MENNKNEGYTLEMLPKSWRVNYAFYKGRYHMYSSEFELANDELQTALRLCHKDYI